MKKLLVALVLVFVLAFAGTALAASETDFDFLRFSKEKVLPDFHPTVKVEEATSDYFQEPEEKDGVVSARVNIFYSGWFKKHSMLVQIDLRPDTGLVKVSVLQDSNGLNLTGSKIFKDNSWVELSSLNWK